MVLLAGGSFKAQRLVKVLCVLIGNREIMIYILDNAQLFVVLVRLVRRYEIFLLSMV